MDIRSRDIARRLVDTAVGAFVGTAGRVLESDRLPPADHRPWPLPAEPWVMAQTWQRLLFAHWPVEPDDMRALVPPGLELDIFDGTAWLGVTPFGVHQLRVRGLPAIPGLSDFDEINVRTYVTVDDKPGVFFFSLDADSALGVEAARLWYRLPYCLASMTVDTRDGWRHFATTRTQTDAKPARFSVAYRPAGPVQYAERGSLAWWLTERYCLYTVTGPAQFERAEIHHAPWPLQSAEARIRTNTMAEPLGLRLEAEPALLHYAETLDVSVWPPHPLRRSTSRRGRAQGGRSPLPD